MVYFCQPLFHVNALTGFLSVFCVRMSDTIVVKVANGSSSKITHKSPFLNHPVDLEMAKWKNIVAFAGTWDVRRVIILITRWTIGGDFTACKKSQSSV